MVRVYLNRSEYYVIIQFRQLSRQRNGCDQAMNKVFQFKFILCNFIKSIKVFNLNYKVQMGKFYFQMTIY